MVFLGMNVRTDTLVEFSGNTTNSRGIINNPICIDEESSNNDDDGSEEDDSDSSGLDPSSETEYMASSSYATASFDAPSSPGVSDDDFT